MSFCLVSDHFSAIFKDNFANIIISSFVQNTWNVFITQSWNCVKEPDLVCSTFVKIIAIRNSHVLIGFLDKWEMSWNLQYLHLCLKEMAI